VFSSTFSAISLGQDVQKTEEAQKARTRRTQYMGDEIIDQTLTV
jgi:hypothetical protein